MPKSLDVFNSSSSSNEAAVAVRETSKRSNNIVLPNAQSMIGEARLQRLQSIIQIAAVTRDDCLQLVVNLFPLFGVEVCHARLLLGTLNEYRLGCINDCALPLHLKMIRTASRLAYDMLQISVDLIKHYSRVKLIRKLPAHMIEGQMLAAQNAIPGLAKTEYGLYDSSEFVWCSICGAVYSMVRESKSNWKKVYKYGLRDVVVVTKTNKTTTMMTTKVPPLLQVDNTVQRQGSQSEICALRRVEKMRETDRVPMPMPMSVPAKYMSSTNADPQSLIRNRARRRRRKKKNLAEVAPR